MPVYAFDTPEPIHADIRLDAGQLRLIAGEVARTVVELRPVDRHDPCDAATVRLAQVTYEDGKLVVSAPRASGHTGGTGAVSLEIRLPAGSHVQADALAADLITESRLGECRLTTDCGHIQVHQAGSLRLSQVLGNASVGHVSGTLTAHAECGDVTILHAEGTVHLSRTRGSTVIGEAGGDVYVYADSGDLAIGRAYSAVEARAAQGNILIDEAACGPLELETASGRLEIGLAAGVGARLDVDSQVGTVYRSLDLLAGDALGAGAAPAAAGPGAVVAVKAHAIVGDIVVRRAGTGTGAGERS
ncbi:DUF4097 domain-containing protein [Streptomyces sp. A7024]|uniref:DUF4097 domain-containing protein n=1 Tax=Streptomyces coryli TaxID=1128680 RepID=A0A6G4U6A9_9ACTN|nr:DUF4097 domain-containing protein [Streptomyces coryli]NGN67714.1 DUF4097 domain-containing protein [Streptomyces coryli]